VVVVEFAFGGFGFGFGFGFGRGLGAGVSASGHHHAAVPLDSTAGGSPVHSVAVGSRRGGFTQLREKVTAAGMSGVGVAVMSR
jgi:hypothetical protein